MQTSFGCGTFSARIISHAVIFGVHVQRVVAIFEILDGVGFQSPINGKFVDRPVSLIRLLSVALIEGLPLVDKSLGWLGKHGCLRRRWRGTLVATRPPTVRIHGPKLRKVSASPMAAAWLRSSSATLISLPDGLLGLVRYRAALAVVGLQNFVLIAHGRLLLRVACNLCVVLGIVLQQPRVQRQATYLSGVPQGIVAGQSLK